MHDWQKNIWAAISGSGIKASEMKIIMNGRNIGKSTMAQMWNQMEQLAPPHEILAKAPVDGTMWYTIACRKDVSMWVRENGVENIDWYEHIDSRWYVHKNMFDICEELYMILKLRWGC